MMLADLGADVIKIENPIHGDFIRADDSRHLHEQANKNKRSVTIDLRNPAGQQVLGRLLDTADVFVTNARAGRNRKLGLEYDQIRARRPQIVYCQTTGFGATGPYATLPVHSQMMDALAGSMPVEVGPDGLTRPKDQAVRSESLMFGGEATTTGAIFAAFHIAAGLAQVAKTGEGCYIDVSSSDSVIADAWTAATVLMNRPASSARDEIGIARYQWYETQDHRFVMFCPVETKFWEAFCDIVNRPDLKEKTYGVDLRRSVQEIFRTKTCTEWVELAIANDLPLSPANQSIGEVRADPQIAARGMFVDGITSRDETFTYIGQPALVRGQDYTIRRPAPDLGEDTDQVLADLGYSKSEIEDLARTHVTQAPDGVRLPVPEESIYRSA
jgi:crotonobetainyl-CoA:carnitine CoA-transferase CaiB-like acyl-CoA transferase